MSAYSGNVKQMSQAVIETALAELAANWRAEPSLSNDYSEALRYNELKDELVSKYGVFKQIKAVDHSADYRVIDQQPGNEMELSMAPMLEPKIEQLSYRDVLHTKKHIGHIELMLELANQLGYPYFIWNDRVYRAESEACQDIGLTAAAVI